MSLAINHNLMASNISRSLNQHYSRLYQSTQRLSSGLRINGAADDAAGLAIRELQRADIAALHQGARNVNDAISMIQTFDGALSVIDEKLIRMKELAEQASTGTYNSTQRLMIDSEFIAMASEINRIAVATDFNGVKLLCNDVSNKMPTPIIRNMLFDNTTRYHIDKDPTIQKEITIINSSAINAPIQNLKVKSSHYIDIIEFKGDPVIQWFSNESWSDTGHDFPEGVYKLQYSVANDQWTLLNNTDKGEPFEYYDIEFGSNSGVRIWGQDEFGNDKNYYLEISEITKPGFDDTESYKSGAMSPLDIKYGYHLKEDTTVTLRVGDHKIDEYKILENADYPKAQIVGQRIEEFGPIYNPLSPNPTQRIHTANIFEIDLDGDGNADVISKFLSYGKEGGIDPLGNPIIPFTNNSTIYQFDLNIDFTTKIHFGTGNDSAEDYYYIDTRDCTLKGLGIDDLRIETQEKAQKALVRINDAIERKDNARAYFGAIQNRLENTVTNLQTQAENLQAAESRISDTDVAIEMTNFIRNQILTQSATAMLSQANSLPQMAMQIIGG